MSSKGEDNKFAYIQDCLDDGTPIDFVFYIRTQKIEKRYVFNKYFKSIIEKLLSKLEEHEDPVIKWAQTIIDNDFEVIERYIFIIDQSDSIYSRSLNVQK